MDQLLLLLLTTASSASVDNQLVGSPSSSSSPSTTAADNNGSCQDARLRCLYRQGCRQALHNYMVGCREVVAGTSHRCNDFCTKSLVALTSTKQGLALMECDCGDDSFCQLSKTRLDPCRAAVERANNNVTSVTCEVAQWICSADDRCRTALDYYFRNCGAMFAGSHCGARCNNSIAILRRQRRAAKLLTCRCEPAIDSDGGQFTCRQVMNNMRTLCFRHRPSVDDWDNVLTYSQAPSIISSTPSSLLLLLLTQARFVLY